MHCLGLVEHDLSSDVGVDFRVVTEANIVKSRASVENLQRNLSRKLVGAREPDDCEYTFDVLTMDSRTERNPRTKHKYIYPQAPIAKSVLHMKHEVSKK